MASDQNWREKGEGINEQGGRGERDAELPATKGWWSKIAGNERKIIPNVRQRLNGYSNSRRGIHDINDSSKLLQLPYVQFVDEEFI